jgi:hypothetical protein
VKILGYDYTVKGVGKVFRFYGEQNADDLTISYRTDIARQMQESTILHEIIEAINYHGKVGLSERQIMALESGLYGTLTDTGVDLSRLVP